MDVKLLHAIVVILENLLVQLFFLASTGYNNTI